MSKAKKKFALIYLAIVIATIMVIIDGIINKTVAGSKEYIVGMIALLMIALVALIRAKY
ncbi:MAG: hypothetical protein QW776_03080 [Candidatus Nitrosocaldus sp.]